MRLAAWSRRGLMWFVAVVLAAVGAVVHDQITSAPHRISSALSSPDKPGTGPDFVVSTELVHLDDEGRSAATPRDFQPTAEQSRFLSRQGAAASDEFTGLEHEAGATELEKQTIRLTLTGRSDQQVDIVDMRPEIVRRGTPPAGTLFDAPPQAGPATFPMLLDLDRPYPVIHEAQWDQDTDSFDPGPPFFARRTITLHRNEQNVVVLRSTSLKYDVAFRLQVTYMLGSTEKHVTVDDHGRPFEVTGLHVGAKGKPDYHRVFTLQGDFSICQTVGPGTDTRRCYDAAATG